MDKWKWLKRALVAGVPAGIATWGYVRYRRELQEAREAALAGATVIDTARGPVEYATLGEGPPVLVLHGTGGGYDQGLLLAEAVGLGFQWISPSRFGYLRAPLPEDSAPAGQADTHAALLDALHVERVAVVAIGSGALSAVEFALRHPGRCAGLVLLSPSTWSPETEKAEPPGTTSAKARFVLEVLLRSDGLLWLGKHLAQPSLLEFLGVPAELQERLTDEERDRLSEWLHTMQPIEPRLPGIDNDSLNYQTRSRPDLEKIGSPTLIVAAADDPTQTLPNARYLAEHIPGARLIGLDRGGHLLVGDLDDVWSRLSEFLNEHIRTQQPSIH